MAFDNPTRNRLATLVGAVRDLLTREFDAKLQEVHGIYAGEGRVLGLDKLPHLDDEKLRVAALLRERINHLAAAGGGTPAAISEAVRRVLREQAFTVLNRFAALRMAEERGIIVESVGGGLNSKGFKAFSEVTYSGLGTAYERYRVFLRCMFDEMSTELGVLFDRMSPYGLLFPRENVLLELFDLLNAPEAKPLWKEDETIGWVYQYFNDPAERKKMRDESAAPRNSRELAVRNQFFTPRYVVEFLTDNTLGRIWYEMTQGETKLKEQCRYLIRRPNEIFLKPGETVPDQPKQDDLAQDDLLKQPVHIPHRPLKDPRTILMLDPACGSMHFGLYAFDLFEVIYDEAWELEEKLGADALSPPPGMKSLHAIYTGKDACLKDVPRLIIEHNLHGIDIDPRCAQIAGLSLWLRAQKAWQRLGLKPAERPAVKRSNIVCAEPMPGEKELLREFVEREFPAAERGVCLRLLEAIFDKMQLAGEAGSLLRIEEEIRSAIEDARDAWQKLATKPPELFTTTELNQLSTAPELTGLEQAVSSLTTDFWQRIEERIYAALRDYAEQAENGGGFQRRLFAEDAARGFAFIDVCRKRYDVALMNPPFGLPPDHTFKYLESTSPLAYTDVYPAFFVRASILAKHGLIGTISSRSFLITPRLHQLREQFLNERITIIADLGLNVMDSAEVESAATVFAAENQTSAIVLALDVRTHADRESSLRHFIDSASTRACARSAFAKIPRNKLLYNLDSAILKLLTESQNFEPLAGTARCGGRTFDDFRFLRLHWEVPSNNKGKGRGWVTFAKGGEVGPYYRDLELAVNTASDMAEICEKNRQINGQTAQARQASDYYYQAGATYSQRSKSFNVRILHRDSIFSSKGPAVFANADVPLCYVIGWLNSSLITALVAMQANKQQYDTGILKRLPWITPSQSEIKEVEGLTQNLILLLQGISSSDECSPIFNGFKLFTAENLTSNAKREWMLQAKTATEANEAQRRVNKQVESSYGVTAGALKNLGDECDEISDDNQLWKTPKLKIQDSAFEVLQCLLGALLGRWDIRYATGEQAARELPDPFAPLPVCPPGQLQNAQGLPARPEDVPAAYPVGIPWDGILVDDPNHPLDIERRVREVIEIIWTGNAGGPAAEGIEHEACEILGVKSLRDYFRKPLGFFADHLKRYSKSRRQAPIYWPLSTPSGSYTLWIYYHRLTDQTLFQCVNEFVKPKITEVEGDLSRLTTAGADKPGARGEIERLTTLRSELVEFRDELLRVAQLPYKPNLNDGVLITASPLWKLFRLPKWQKDLKSCWESLSKGEYDWAHLAYTMWPDRVREVCKKDRSIAIAHGLEELCEIKAPEKKAKKGQTKKEQMDLEEVE